MIRYYITKDERLCCGCRACEQICPSGAVAMRSNKEGFIYPVINELLCIDCGLCSKICPMENRPAGRTTETVYAVQHRDNEILSSSSSGGVFRLLADHIIRSDGCVVGCKWGENNRPVLAVAERKDQLLAMQGSKYLFSDTGTIYSQIKDRLERGQKVLFTGSPCQCAGLLNYLRHPYDNLITADFLCHGMPSQQVFDAYIETLEKRHGAKVYDIHFRDKEKRGWGMAFSCKFSKRERIQKIFHLGWTDPYLYGFIRGFFHRYSCYTCPFRGITRFTDFTFCDYWGAERYHSEIPCEKGVSAITMNTEKARALKDILSDQAMWFATDISEVAEGNASLLSDAAETVPALRNEIYDQIRIEGWSRVERQHLRTRYWLIKKIWYSMPRRLTSELRKWIK